MASPSSLPANVHVSSHPCLRAKLSQLRSRHANARETKVLVHEIALIVGCEALAKSLQTTASGTVSSVSLTAASPVYYALANPKISPYLDKKGFFGAVLTLLAIIQGETPLGYAYAVESTAPSVALVPVLRSGLGMLDALQTLLPEPVPVHHLGLFREPTSLQPVEYYNNLPYHRPTSVNPDPFPIPSVAILLDPLIATGGTSSAAVQTLLEWGAKKVVVISVLGSEEGVRRAAEENGSESVEVWVGGLDGAVDERGMIRPGLGDVGDRLFLTIGK